MKKFLFVFAFLSFIILNFVSAQDSTSVRVPSTVEIVMDKVGAAITTLATKLQAPAEHVYALVIKQQVIIGTIGFSFNLLLWIVFLICLSKYNYYFKLYIREKAKLGSKDTGEQFYSQQRAEVYQDHYQTFGGFSLAFGVMDFIYLLLSLFVFLPKLLNPEYAAIQRIMSFIN